MKKIIKNFPLTFYAIAFSSLFFLFITFNPDMNTSNPVTFFWNAVLVIFFPMVVGVKNGNILTVVFYIFLLDLILLYIRTHLIPKIKSKLKPNLTKNPRENE
jgi:hypothetical protein